MKKTLVLATVLSVALSGLGFAAATPACAKMAPMPGHSMAAKTSDCCPKGACPCAVEERANDQSMPSSSMVDHPAQPVIAHADLLDLVFPGSTVLRTDTFDTSPPTQLPLYQIFSVYRI